jgi:osmotically-inducible protein OsmY
VAALALAGPLGCGSEPEVGAPPRTAEEAAERLADARREVEALRERAAESQEELDAAQAEVESAESALEKARQAHAQARNALRDAEQKLASIEPPPPSDQELFRRVQKQLLEAPALAQVAIAAEVKDRSVTLHGIVPDEGTREAAITVARSVEGVANVDSRIELAD